MPSIFWVAISIGHSGSTPSELPEPWESSAVDAVHIIFPGEMVNLPQKKTYRTDGFPWKCGRLPNGHHGHPIPSGDHWGGWKIQHDHVETLWITKLSHSNPWICNRNSRNTVIIITRWPIKRDFQQKPDGSRPNPQDWATWYCSSARGGACCILLGVSTLKAWLIRTPPGHLVPWPRYWWTGARKSRGLVMTQWQSHATCH